MDKSHKDIVIEKAPFAYAHHKIILNKKGEPVDYEFIEINPAFEKLTGLKAQNVINHKATEAIPEITNKKGFNWIKFYGKIALNNTKEEFEQYSLPLKRWYKVYAYSTQKLFFTTIFTDITKEKSIIEISERFLQIPESKPDYQGICDAILDVTNAKFIALNLFDSKTNTYVACAVSGNKTELKKTGGLNGFKIINKIWNNDSDLISITDNEKIIHLNKLSNQNIKNIRKEARKTIEDTLKIGKIVIIKITNSNKLLGNFTIIMNNCELLENESLWEIFAQKSGLFIEYSKIQEDKFSNEDKYRRLLENMGEGIGIIDPDEVFIFTNPAAEKFFGVNKGELEGNSLKQFLSKDSFKEVLKQTRQRQKGIESKYELEIIRANGEKRHLDITASPQFDKDNNFIGTYAIFRDYSIRREVEQTLKTYENIFNHINDMICVISCDGHFIEVNPAWQKNTGWKKEELLSKKLTCFIHINDIASTIKAFDNVCNGIKMLHYQNRFICKDKSAKWFLWDLIPYDNENVIIGIVRNYTNYVILEKEKEEYYKLLIERIKELTFLNNFSKYVFISQPPVNDIFKQIIDLMPHAFQSPEKTFISIKTDKKNFKTRNFKKTRFSISKSIQTENYGKIAITVYVDFSEGETKTTFYNEEKSLLDTVADIINNYIQKTEAIKNEKQSKQKFIELFDSVNDIVFTADTYGNIISVNKEFVKQIGYKPSTNFNIFSVLIYNDSKFLKAKMIEDFKKKKKQSFFDIDLITSKGTTRTYEVRLKIKYTKNKVEEIFGMARDVTELITTQNILMRTIIETEEKGRKHFAEELHDGIGPLLSGINMYLEKIQSNKNLPKEDDKLLKYCNELVNDTITQIRVISNDLMPRLISKYGLSKSLNSFINKIKPIGKVNISVTGDNIEANHIPNDLGITLYRSITELLNNTLKHSNAENIYINTSISASIIAINYVDDGSGLRINNIQSIRKPSGLGIRNIISRIKSFNGKVIFPEDYIRGFSVKFEIPLSNKIS